MDALERKYLKSFTLEITDRTGVCIEAYTLNYSYVNDEIQCSVTMIEDQVKLSSKLENSVRGVIRNLMTLTSSAASLPPDARTLLKISYQPNTPPDYEPPGFKPYLDDTSPTKNMSRFLSVILTEKQFDVIKENSD
ncbi:Meiosis-specific protein PAIR2 [Frankliniella fusca]|uniref:Meiosis-specific protein PAIR2 n=1 Tax=Frankliniella fusca TaxID=407009 RepID=A0AAE1HQK5_9NEOP|nr:Meiosis-specific protein PAIR2 [Frankliniella fusca]